MLGDEALGLICGMLPPDGAKSGKTMLFMFLTQVKFLFFPDLLNPSVYSDQ